MLRKLRLLVVICAAFSVAMGMSARAEAESFKVAFGGSATVDWDFNFVDIGIFDGIDFTQQADVHCGGTYEACTGGYSGLNGQSIQAFYSSFSYDLGASVNQPLWSFVDSSGGTYAFNLLSVTEFTEIRQSGFLNVRGLGTAYIPGYLDVDGNPEIDADWSFTATGLTTTFTFASETLATPQKIPMGQTPDGGSTAALLGSILIGFGIVRRRFFRD